MEYKPVNSRTLADINRANRSRDANLTPGPNNPGWSDKGSAGGFSVGQRVRVRTDTGLGPSEGAGKTFTIKNVHSQSKLLQMENGKVYAAHHLEAA